MSEPVLEQDLPGTLAQSAPGQPQPTGPANTGATGNPLSAVGAAPDPGCRLALESMADVPVTLVFEVARIDISIGQLLELKAGSLLALPATCLDSVVVLVDGEEIALGDITTDRERYGVRIERYLPLAGEDGGRNQ